MMAATRIGKMMMEQTIGIITVSGGTRRQNRHIHSCQDWLRDDVRFPMPTNFKTTFSRFSSSPSLESTVLLYYAKVCLWKVLSDWVHPSILAVCFISSLTLVEVRKKELGCIKLDRGVKKVRTRAFLSLLPSRKLSKRGHNKSWRNLLVG